MTTQSLIRRADDLRSAVLTARDLDACRRAAVAALDELVAGLEACAAAADEVAALRVPSELPNGVHLTPLQRDLLAVLLDHPKGAKGTIIQLRLYEDRNLPMPESNIIAGVITALRRKLVAAGLSAPGSAWANEGPILHRWGYSEWRLSDEARAGLLALIASAEATR